MTGEAANLRDGGDASGSVLRRSGRGPHEEKEVQDRVPGIRALLGELTALGTCRLAILSNAFFGHWDGFEGTELYGMFELPLSSHLIGATKPSRAAYETALRRMGAAPERVVFIDDKRENVEAARALGLHAFVTDSVARTRAGLSELLGVAPVAAH
jgi:HAD superfamily hydrolase (TIGR01509 family)